MYSTGQVVAAHLHRLFVGMVVEEWAMFRVTRNADLTLEEEEADDLLEAVELELRKRRFNKAVRLQVADTISDEMLEAFAIVAEPAKVAGEMKRRFGGVVDRVLCTFPFATDSERSAYLEELRTA